jgi:hypothetical protein
MWCDDLLIQADLCHTARMPRRRAQVGTFGSHLQNFARSVDIVDEQVLREARDLVHQYLQDELGVAYLELARAHMINEGTGLRTFWSSASKDFSTTIKGPDNQYSSQVAVSYDMRKPLWIVNPQRRPLRTAGNYVDQWSSIADLPPYKAPLEQDLFTSVIIPIWRPDNRIFGVMYLETAKYLDIAEFDSQELVVLADALGVLIDLYDLNKVQTQGTRDAISNLRRIREAVVFPQIALPQIFLAFSAKADKEVIGVLVDVLKEFSGRLRIIQWNKIDDSGTITAQLAEAITTSRFGLCYLSEPREDTGDYTDNQNVLFEAGMLHALTALSIYERSGWIPLREAQSPPPPFDFAGERIEVVPRTGDGRLNEELFRARLSARLQRLLVE